MALTDADRLQMAMLAIMQNNVVKSSGGGDNMIIGSPVGEATGIVITNMIFGTSTLIEK